MDNLTPATQKPFNRASEKFAHVIMFEISTGKQNFIQIRQRVSLLRMRDFGHPFVSAIFLGTSSRLQPRKTRAPIVTHNTPKDALRTNMR